ncbi:ABC transporter permease [Actinotalea sp. K2]|uniref:ABC transporter permease n=1 Tax=Actinotalea sp. K2 TaxID=2939438 RepID=UPI00201756E7|nr:ABC transporter permease [Actinotalea sp. K2]MCL3860313.1 ABC transporter permease [Actinotalea sp. K2]
MTIPGTIGTGPVVDKDGNPLRSLNHVDSRADDPSARESTGTSDPLAPDVRRRGALLDHGWVRGALGTVVPLLVLLVWHVTTTSGLIPPYRLPSPQSVVLAAADLLERGDLLPYIHISTQRVLIGFAIGAVLGLVLGAVVGLSRLGDVLLTTTFSGLRAVPSLAWIPLLIIWLQYGEESKITLIAIGAFFPVYTTVASALRHVDPHLVEAGRAYGLRGAALLGRVQLPAATPAVVSGLRLALAQAWLFLVAAELLGASKGLGFLLTDSQNNGRVDRILLAIVLLAVLGKSTDALIGVAEKRLARRW